MTFVRELLGASSPAMAVAVSSHGIRVASSLLTSGPVLVALLGQGCAGTASSTILLILRVGHGGGICWCDEGGEQDQCQCLVHVGCTVARRYRESGLHY